jgi:hypothetical protein
LCSDVTFYLSIIELLRAKGIYDEEVWKLGFYHKKRSVVREYC